MGAECVLDASVVAAAYYNEIHTQKARAALSAFNLLYAPHLLLLEMGNIAAVKFRRGEVTEEQAAPSLGFVEQIVGRFTSDAELAPRAAELALSHGFSSYDASYLALAERVGAPVLTADLKMVRRAADCGLAHLVESLA